jgi:hypothetical protein
MNKFLIVMITMISFNAIGEWVNGGGSPDEFLWYVDTTRVIKNGNERATWILANFKTSQKSDSGKMYKSYMSRSIFDCKNQLQKMTDVMMYSGSMGSGELVVSYDDLNLPFKNFPPNSIADKQLIMVCKN